jgi:hypothetical protein
LAPTLPLCLCYSCGLCYSTRPYTTAFLLSPHLLQPKVESPDGLVGSTWGFIGLFLPEAATDLPVLAHRLRRIAKSKVFTPDQILWPWVFQLLVCTEENLFPTLNWEVAGLQTTVSLGHCVRRHGFWGNRPLVAHPRRMLQTSQRSWLSQEGTKAWTQCQQPR